MVVPVFAAVHRRGVPQKCLSLHFIPFLSLYFSCPLPYSFITSTTSLLSPPLHIFLCQRCSLFTSILLSFPPFAPLTAARQHSSRTSTHPQSPTCLLFAVLSVFEIWVAFRSPPLDLFVALAFFVPAHPSHRPVPSSIHLTSPHLASSSSHTPTWTSTRYTTIAGIIVTCSHSISIISSTATDIYCLHLILAQPENRETRRR